MSNEVTLFIVIPDRGTRSVKVVSFQAIERLKTYKLEYDAWLKSGAHATILKKVVAHNDGVRRTEWEAIDAFIDRQEKLCDFLRRQFTESSGYIGSARALIARRHQGE